MFMKMGQILSAICREMFVTSPATPSYSNHVHGSENEAGIGSPLRPWNWKGGDSDEEEKPLIFQSSTGVVFQMLLETAAKKVVEDCSENCESIIGKKETVEDDSRDGCSLGNEAGIEDKPVVFQSRESVFQVSSEPVEKKGNDDNPLTFNGTEQRKEVCHLKDKAINKKIVEDGGSIKTALLLQKGDEEKPLIFQSSGGPVFQVHIGLVPKKGNGKPLADQNNKQRKEGNHHKNVGINKSLTPIWKKKETVEDNGNKNEAILIKSSNVTKKKEIVVDLCKNEAIIKPLNATKKKETVENLCKNEAIIKPLNATNKKETVENLCKNEAIIKSLTEIVVDFCKNEAIIKSLTEIVVDLCKNEAIIEPLNPTKKKKKKKIVEYLCKNEVINETFIVENEEEKYVIFKEPAAIKVDYNKLQIKEIDHYKDDELMDKAIEEEKPGIVQALKEPDEDNRQAKSDHHKDETIYKNYLGTNEIVWLKHYNNKQKILMVGEGDFSFSASLAVAFGSSASNITATSFNDSEYLRFSYKNATKNIETLTNGGATVRHGVDATKMSNYSYWKGIKFDRIIYNFPYSGCPKSESRQTQLRQHLELVRGFLVNAKEMLEEDGEIHISHKTNGFHSDWRLKDLAWTEGLWLVEETKFNKSDYPGYQTKQGYNGDNNFDCYPSSTYIFASIPY